MASPNELISLSSCCGREFGSLPYFSGEFVNSDLPDEHSLVSTHSRAVCRIVQTGYYTGCALTSNEDKSSL